MTAPTDGQKAPNPAYLEVNIPRIGHVTALYFFAEKASTKKPGTMMPAQIGFKGTWEMGGGQIWDGMVYVDEYKLDTNLVATGLAKRLPDHEGQPRYEWLEHTPVQLLMRLLPQNKRAVYVSRLEASAAAGAPPPPAVPHGHAPTPASRGPSVPTTASAPPVNDAWTALYEAYERAAQIAIKVWGSQHDPVALAAATATVFIEANKRGLTIRPKLDPAFSEPPPALAGAMRGQPNDGLPW